MVRLASTVARLKPGPGAGQGSRIPSPTATQYSGYSRKNRLMQKRPTRSPVAPRLLGMM